MLRSIGLHQGFHANHLKGVEKELKSLRVEQDNLHHAAMVRTDGPLAAIAEGIERIERMITQARRPENVMTTDLEEPANWRENLRARVST